MSQDELLRAVKKGYERKFERELERADPDEVYDTHPIEAAAWHGRPECARELLEREFDPQGGVEEGRTPLHRALQEDNTEVAKVLVEYGANVDVEDANGNHPLHQTPYDPEIVAALLEAGADPNHENDFGNSFLSMLREMSDGVDDPKYDECLELLSDEQLDHEASGEPKPAGLAAGHDRVTLDGDDADVREWLCEHLVPPLGQADTVQGELLRAVEKLRGEAHRNGNANWNDNYELLLDFLDEQLCDQDVFDAETVDQTRRDVESLRGGDINRDFNDDIYARLRSRVVEFCEHEPELIEKPENENLAI